MHRSVKCAHRRDIKIIAGADFNVGYLMVFEELNLTNRVAGHTTGRADCPLRPKDF